MWAELVSATVGVMQRGGVVMWPLLGLSVVAAVLVVERFLFFAGLRSRATRRRVDAAAAALRAGDADAARRAVEGDGGLFAGFVRDLLAERPSEALALELLEQRRRLVDRFLSTLSTIITAAPMLGILGTVLGIINSFAALSDPAGGRDPRLVGQGIAEALITTAAGLVVALLTLFPYNVLRSRADAVLNRLEALAAARPHADRGAVREEHTPTGPKADNLPGVDRPAPSAGPAPPSDRSTVKRAV